MTLPVKSSGVSTSTCIIGSSSTGSARRMPSLNAMDAAMRKAFSFESTSWYEPKKSVAFTSTTAARQHAGVERFADALVHGWDELARHHAALDRVDELVALARLLRLQLQHHMAILATTARLLDELAFDLVAGLADGLAVGHLRLAHGRLHAELALHPVHQDLQVQFAHAGDDRLPRLFIGAHAERRIFLCQPAQRDAHLFLVGLGLGPTACEITGSGNTMRSRMMTCAGSLSVSPVVTSFTPTAAAMSPA